MSTALSEVVRSQGPVVPHRPIAFDSPGLRIAPRVRAGLLTCFEAYAYARSLDRNPWDFAVEISALRRIGLSCNDLRWTVGRGLLECASEISLPGDAERSFRRQSGLLFCKKTCFVLTQFGGQAARAADRPGQPGHQSCGGTVVASARQQFAHPVPLVPKWDRDRQTLKIGRAVVKHFKVPATNQEMILAAFEEEAWPPRIDDPLPPRREQLPKRRLRETIKSLNRNQKQSLIRFIGDGSGQGIRWELCGENQLAC
jgi:hypothetical protein